MSMGPIGGVVGSAAGAPLSQTKGAEAERSQRDAATQATTREADKKAEQSSGVGQTQEDQGASDRDADGRRLWEAPPDPATDQEEASTDPSQNSKAKDPTGASGGQLDLMG